MDVEKWSISPQLVPAGVEVAEVAGALLDVALAHPGILLDQAISDAVVRLGGDDDDGRIENLLDHVLDLLADDGDLAVLAGDRVVHVASLTDDSVLTHPLSREERARSWLQVDFDLAPFAHRDSLRSASGHELVATVDGAGRDIWEGPEGWLPTTVGAASSARRSRWVSGGLERAVPSEWADDAGGR